MAPDLRRVQFAGVFLNLPEWWVDITETLPESTPPTLAVENGFGALQFTVAKYKSGEVPAVDETVLDRLLSTFEAAQELERLDLPVKWREEEPVFGLRCDYEKEDDFIRIWYSSDGRSVAFVTFVSKATAPFREELDEADAIIRSLSFDE